jgi:phosphatidylglycerophosphate synthase
VNGLTAWAWCIFAVAVLTDALDGHVARRLGGASPFLGPYSDAVADVFLILAALCFCLADKGTRIFALAG